MNKKHEEIIFDIVKENQNLLMYIRYGIGKYRFKYDGSHVKIVKVKLI